MDASTQTLQNLLTRARFEVLPLRSAIAELEQLSPGATVTVTSSPAKGPEATLDLAERAAARGFHVVPHLAARLIADTAQLSTLLDRMERSGLNEAFVVAGDSTASPGDFPDALSLLRGMEELGRRPARVGITGYPEQHSFLPDSATTQAMNDKAHHADYIVSQICYDPNTIISWVREVRERGVLLPIHIGIPGSIDVSKLLRVSMKMGIGDSMRFLRKQRGVVTKLLSRYTPDHLIDELGPYLLDESFGLAGWHVYTFNEVEKTVQWRDALVARMQEVPA